MCRYNPLHSVSVIVAFLMVLISSATTVSAQLAHAASAVVVSDTVNSASEAGQYGKLPLSFIANAGQIDPSVRFQVRSSGGTLSFGTGGVMLNLLLIPNSPHPQPLSGETG